jgi:ketosteroid isomerase-like protein
MTTPLAAQDRRQEEANRAAVARSFEAWRTGTGSPYDLLAEHASWTITGNSAAAKTYPSRQAFISEVIQPFNARMQSRLVPAVRKLYAEGDSVIAFFDASGTARDGRPYVNTYAWILEMRDGSIIRAHAFFDSIEFDDLWRRVEPGPGATTKASEGNGRH